MITAELAAKIVKDYLLPMFETKSTYLKTENSTLTSENLKEDIQKNKTISNEVKLTVRLNEILENTRDQLQ